MISRAFRPCIFLGLQANVILCIDTSSTDCVTGNAGGAGISRSQGSGLTAGPDCLSLSLVHICALNLSVLHDENYCVFYTEAVPLSLKRLCASWVWEVSLVELLYCGNKKPKLQCWVSNTQYTLTPDLFTD